MARDLTPRDHMPTIVGVACGSVAVDVAGRYCGATRECDFGHVRGPTGRRGWFGCTTDPRWPARRRVAIGCRGDVNDDVAEISTRPRCLGRVGAVQYRPAERQRRASMARTTASSSSCGPKSDVSRPGGPAQIRNPRRRSSLRGAISCPTNVASCRMPRRAISTSVAARERGVSCWTDTRIADVRPVSYSRRLRGRIVGPRGITRKGAWSRERRR